MKRNRKCPDCGARFENAFEEADHLVEDEKDFFDPTFEIQDGYSLRLGSLLRNFYNMAGNTAEVKRLAEETFEVLYISHVIPEKFTRYAKEAFINAAMRGLDYEYKKLVENEKDDNEK
jgi:hypothetical protein